MASQKSSGLAALLSFLWCGLGQIYNGQIIKGVIMMITFPPMTWFGLTLSLGSLIVGAGAIKPEDSAAAGGMAVVGFILSIGAFVLWIFGMVSAYRSAERFNQRQIVASA
jgi:TM2 domain-containing membrane protein YozV